jgi:cyclohexanecarboxylate-CoA ligase
MTECPIMTFGHPGDTRDELRTEGQPSRGVRLVTVDAEGHPAPVGVQGEITVAAAPQLFLGYLAGQGRPPTDAAGRFHTGDLGYLDSGGFVTITGRLKDVIIRKGENISAREVEDLLVEHPSVAEAAVVGISDPEVGERCCAVVVPDPRAAEPITLTELVGYLRGRGLMPQKLPERLDLRVALPRNATGKVVKEQLRQELRGTAS